MSCHVLTDLRLQDSQRFKPKPDNVRLSVSDTRPSHFLIEITCMSAPVRITGRSAKSRHANEAADSHCKSRHLQRRREE
jgi:hypothetical protein